MALRVRGLAAFLLSLAAAAALPAGAVDEDDLLPVDQAFALSANAPAPDRIQLRWKIADGYYLYRHRISVQATGFQAKPLQLPNGKKHTDEFFGPVETYRGELVATLPGATIGQARQVSLKVKYQGCADLGVCYPPQTRTLSVSLPMGSGSVGAASAASSSDQSSAQSQNQPLAAEAAPTKSNSGDAGFSAFGKSLGAGGASAQGIAANGAADALPLPPEQAFKFEAIADGGNALLLRFTPAKGYYLYRDKTALKLEGADGVMLGKPAWPKGVAHRDEHFGDVVVYFDQIDLPVPLARSVADARKATLTATFQGCQNDGICYPPMTRTVALSIPAGAATSKNDQAALAGAASIGAASAASSSQQEEATPTPIVPEKELAAEAASTKEQSGDAASQAEDSRLAAALAGSHRWLALLGFFVAGLLLAFTPCVLPMIPILSGLIAGRGERVGAMRAFSLSLVYVLASAVVFTVAGVLAGLLGAGANLQTAFQKPWVIVAFAALFVALSLSMFGLYELQLPAFLRAKLGAISDKQRGGSLWGVAAMGMLSALIVGPCVAPPLAGAVLFISQTRDAVFGGAALFLLAMGMGAPLLAFGVAAGRGMPTSGPWMTAVQRVFGFVFVGLAIWMLSRILPGAATLALYGVLALAVAAWAFSLARPDSGERTRWIARFFGLLLAVVGAAELLGAMAGGKDPLQPLAGAIGGKRETRELPFRMIKSSADLDRELAAARAAGKPLLFDFYADWCVSCKEMEKYTFAEPAVHAALADFVLLKADVTANDDLDQALMKRFGIIGPPATLFFADGAERRELRLVGFEKADAFVQRSAQAR
ncbi:protein-disulfide reductase DsbD [Luteimonas gilva]|uniref:Thiol:disulfide interchange protein DsbD n=1 Tax=Luteimonas gilva TaxID=2572684 RepID=A0A4U5JRM4_9GAMM|nr:protein-disulfide reductase DsbD [Luteimonas gilva]TKR30637.1 protein-disulfide reductase DsbD [Luteimonas gilva]